MTWESRGFGKAARLIRVAEAAENMRPALEAFVEIVLELNDARFDAQPWKKLSPETVARKLREGQDSTILEASGVLRESLTVRGARNNVVEIGADEVFVGTNRYTARFHRKGRGGSLPSVGFRGSAPMPKRRPVSMRKADKQRILDELQDYLTPLGDR